MRSVEKELLGAWCCFESCSLLTQHQAPNSHWSVVGTRHRGWRVPPPAC